jgi:hypothetical protein
MMQGKLRHVRGSRVLFQQLLFEPFPNFPRLFELRQKYGRVPLLSHHKHRHTHPTRSYAIGNYQFSQKHTHTRPKSPSYKVDIYAARDSCDDSSIIDKKKKK